MTEPVKLGDAMGPMVERIQRFAAKHGLNLNAPLGTNRPRPRCPVCAIPDAVEPNRGDTAPWLCAGCWTTFAGTQDEWQANAARRERLSKDDTKGAA